MRKFNLPIAASALFGSLVMLGMNVGAADAQPSSANCAAAKVSAAGKKAYGKLKCHEKAIRKSAPVDPVCLAKVELKFIIAFDKAEIRGGCATVDDSETIELKVDGFVDDIVASLPAGSTTTPTPTLSATPTTSPTPTPTRSPTPTTTPTPGSPCSGGAAFPMCGGTCPGGLECVAKAFGLEPRGCVCEALMGSPPCGSGLQQPQCDGFCPPGSFCMDQGGCVCEEINIGCGTSCPACDPPLCAGDCPDGGPCVDTGGTCTCGQ